MIKSHTQQVKDLNNKVKEIIYTMEMFFSKLDQIYINN